MDKRYVVTIAGWERLSLRIETRVFKCSEEAKAVMVTKISEMLFPDPLSQPFLVSWYDLDHLLEVLENGQRDNR
jgi:hypothetical protein